MGGTGGGADGSIWGYMREALPIIVWSLPVVLLILGAALAWTGLRGRQLDNHPICRRCGFDLYGSFQSEVCPECGAALCRENVRLGNFESRPLRISIGLFLMAPAVTVLAALGVAAQRGVQWDHHKPLWLLVREADAPALAEIERRRTGKLLTPAQIASVVEHALALQGDRARNGWHPRWGDFIEAAWVGGGVSQAQWQRYAQQAITLELDAEPLVVRGAPLYLVLRCDARLGSYARLGLRLSVVHAAVADVPLAKQYFQCHLSREGSTWMPRRYYMPIPLNDPGVAALPDGPHPLDARVNVALLRPPGNPTDLAPLKLPPGATLKLATITATSKEQSTPPTGVP